jgi:alkylation response protein AidB-like acyl-CoA dehydrogenase
MTVTTNAIAAVERAVEIIGNPGLSRANQIERHLRDVLCWRIHTPQNDSILLAAGRAAFKAPGERGERP